MNSILSATPARPLPSDSVIRHALPYEISLKERIDIVEQIKAKPFHLVSYATDEHGLMFFLPFYCEINGNFYVDTFKRYFPK